MGLTIVTGRAGSGKSRFLMGQIKKLIQNPLEKIIVIVPGQLTFETEKSILRECGVQGMFGLEVLSIQRLAYRILDETGSVCFMSGAAKAMACHLALQHFDAPFGGSGHLPDFELCLGALFTQLKIHSQTPKSLRRTAQGLSDAALSSKLLQTADIYEKYLEICGSRLDIADMYAQAAARADGAAFLRGAYVFIDGADSYAPAVTAMLGAVMALSKQTVAAFRAEGDGNDAALFASEKRDMERLIRAAQARGLSVKIEERTQMPGRHASAALAFLEKNLYSYPYTPSSGEPEGIIITAAESIGQEVDALAAHIMEEVRLGRRFQDIAVAGGGLDAYLPAIKSTFAQCGIPYFVDERRALSQNAFYAFFDSALCAAAGDMAAAEGYVYSDYAPISDAQRGFLQNYARQYAYKGWHYYGAFRRGSGAQQAEALRGQLMRPLKALADGLKAKSVRAQVEAIRRFLDDCRISDKIAALCESPGTQDLHSERAYFAQIYGSCHKVLDDIEHAAEGRPLSPKTLCSLVRTGFESTKIAVIPPATDEVRVFDVSVGRLPVVDVLFAIGVHDGVWPARDSGAAILSAAERDTLQGLGVDIGGYDLAEEKLKVYAALSKPKERLYISHNAQTGQPSVLTDRIRRLFPALQNPKNPTGGSGNTAPPLAACPGFAARVLGALADVLRGKQADAMLRRICAHYLAVPGWRQDAQTMLLRTNAAFSLPTETAKLLYGGLRCSATRIENFYNCPFRHFLDHGVKAQPPRDYEYDRIDIGTYLHLALDLFTKALIEERVDIKTLSEEQTRMRMEAAARSAAQQHDHGKLLEDERFALMQKQLARELVDTALRIRAHFADSGASLHASEVTFEHAIGAPGGSVTITGKIDRIDTAGGYFRVVDYKSSSTRFDANAFAAGTALQLPVYIDAVRQLLQKDGLLPAGGYYMRIGETYCDSAEQAQKDARMHGLSLADAQVLMAFSSVMENGGFVAIDQAVTASGALHGRGAAKFFSAAEMEALLRMARDLIASAAVRIYRGETGISPTQDACKLCGYAGVCRINPEYAGNAYREAPRFDKAALCGEGV